jgi:hypothetical protein
LRRAGSTDDLRAGVTLGQAFPALAGPLVAMAGAVVIATAPMALRMVRQVRRIASPSTASRLRCTRCTPAWTRGAGTDVRRHRSAGTGPQRNEIQPARRATRPPNWNSSPAALRWSVAGLLDLNSRSGLRRIGGPMVTRHKNADYSTKYCTVHPPRYGQFRPAGRLRSILAMSVAGGDRAGEGRGTHGLIRHGRCRSSAGARPQ